MLRRFSYFDYFSFLVDVHYWLTLTKKKKKGQTSKPNELQKTEQLQHCILHLEKLLKNQLFLFLFVQFPQASLRISVTKPSFILLGIIPCDHQNLEPKSGWENNYNITATEAPLPVALLLHRPTPTGFPGSSCIIWLLIIRAGH